jgi:hypothetical protein
LEGRVPRKPERANQKDLLAKTQAAGSGTYLAAALLGLGSIKRLQAKKNLTLNTLPD